MFSLCLSWDSHFLLPSDISGPGFGAFKFWPWLYTSVPYSQAFEFGLNYVYHWFSWFSSLQMMDLETSVINFFLFCSLSLYVCVCVWVCVCVCVWFCFFGELRLTHAWFFVSLVCLRILVPPSRDQVRLQQWNCWVLTSRPSGNSQYILV